MVSVGCDLEQAARFPRLLKNDRFLQGVYTAGERAYIRISAHPARTAAGIWCAKEACAKALGRGLFGLLPRELEVIWDTFGAPKMILHGSAAAQFSGLRLSVSISHAGAYVMAAVTAETP
ncbi:MAG: holo-ACP synthase [Clostridiaceae bacterium]|nr:holo-ACP synthase [Clostridiaceae bacterium]